jgi:GNAT superfamily N-acetyltransferase
MDEERAEPDHGAEVNSTEKQLLDLYNRCVPESYRVTGEAFDGLTDGGELFTRCDGDALIGFALLRQSSLTLLCVDEAYRRRGIGSDLLKQAEDWAGSHGKKRLILGHGSDYVIPGVPTEEGAHRFFEKRGYACTGYTYDMTLTLPPEITVPIPDGVTFDVQPVNDEILAAVEAVEKSWLGVYKSTPEDVLLAKLNGIIAGFCIPAGWTRFDPDRDAGSVSCVGVLPEYRNRGIGLAMVSEALRYLTDNGCTRAELLYTSIPHWYGKLGFVPFHRLWMGEKRLSLRE